MARFTTEDGALAVAVVEAVAEVDGVDPTELPPLYETVTPEAVETLVRDLDTGHVTFTYYGYTVTIRHTFELSVEKR